MNQIEHQLFEKIQKNRILTRFDPPFYPISREQKFTWRWNLAHICRIILASFPRRMNQMKNTLSEIMSKKTHFWPLLTPYLTKKNFHGLETWHTNVILWNLLSLWKRTKSLSVFPRKCWEAPFLTPFSPISRERKFLSKIGLCNFSYLTDI